MIVTRDHILELIKANPKWANWFPYVKGLDFRETQEKRVKEKITEALSFVIADSMEKCEVANGNDFAMDVWRLIAAELSRMGWANVNGVATYGPMGGLKVKWNPNPMGIFKKIYRNASLKAEKERGFKPIANAVDQVVSETLRQREIA